MGRSLFLVLSTAPILQEKVYLLSIIDRLEINMDSFPVPILKTIIRTKYT